MRLRWPWHVLPLLLVLGACKGDSGEAACRTDADCGTPVEAYRCEQDTGACRCRTDTACGPAELCNAAGFCQARAGCESNADCGDAALFCDTGTGTCLRQGRCTTDLHCPLGEVCDVSRATCVEGCRSAGDCPGTACRCGDAPCACDATTPEGRAACALGVCDPAFCADAGDCAFGERCGAVGPGGSSTCFSDVDPVRRPYCASCTFGGGLEACGRGANFCLREAARPGSTFCGVDCSQGQGCPNGYRCTEVVVASSRTRCRSDAECPGRCVIEEGNVEGFCECQQDADCVQDACSQGTCTVSRQPCAGDTDCRPIRCVDSQGGRGCLVGQNCAPDEGLTCAEVVPR